MFLGETTQKHIQFFTFEHDTIGTGSALEKLNADPLSEAKLGKIAAAAEVREGGGGGGLKENPDRDHGKSANCSVKSTE